MSIPRKILLAGMVAGMLSASALSASAEDIDVAALVEQTGVVGYAGQSVWKGMQLAAEKVNVLNPTEN